MYFIFFFYLCRSKFSRSNIRTVPIEIASSLALNNSLKGPNHNDSHVRIVSVKSYSFFHDNASTSVTSKRVTLSVVTCTLSVTRPSFLRFQAGTVIANDSPILAGDSAATASLLCQSSRGGGRRNARR